MGGRASDHVLKTADHLRTFRALIGKTLLLEEGRMRLSLIWLLSLDMMDKLVLDLVRRLGIRTTRAVR